MTFYQYKPSTAYKTRLSRKCRPMRPFITCEVIKLYTDEQKKWTKFEIRNFWFRNCHISLSHSVVDDSKIVAFLLRISIFVKREVWKCKSGKASGVKFRSHVVRCQADLRRKSCGIGFVWPMHNYARTTSGRHLPSVLSLMASVSWTELSLEVSNIQHVGMYNRNCFEQLNHFFYPQGKMVLKDGHSPKTEALNGKSFYMSFHSPTTKWLQFYWKVNPLHPEADEKNIRLLSY